jgi:hypothetical protein
MSGVLNLLFSLQRTIIEITSSEPYQLLERLFHEQCEFSKESLSDEGSFNDHKIRVKKS